MPSDSALGVVQRHDPSAYQSALSYRRREDLPFDPAAAPDLPLLLDTTIYIDRLTGKLPAPIAALVASRPVLHCSVSLAELTISAGILDPKHPNTAQATQAIHGLLAAVPLNAVLTPSGACWVEAGMLAGTLARTQGLSVPKKSLTADQECCQKGRRRELINDALLYLTAVETNTLLVSRNSRHMDILMTLRPSQNVLLY